MKSQDILLLFKLVSISQNDRTGTTYLASRWEDWDLSSTTSNATDSFDEDVEVETLSLHPLSTHEHSSEAQYSLRSLADMTGISKSQVSLTLGRCYQSGLASIDRMKAVPVVNITALKEFIAYGLKYVFPVSPGALTRGIATAWAAPVLSNTISSGGDTPLVWPDPRGNTKGQSLEPLYRSVPQAVRKDATLYAYLALTDSIRSGRARERATAIDLLTRALDKTNV